MAGQVKPIPVPVILAAVNGDEDALAAVVAHYQKYIRALATRPLKDEYGNTYLYVGRYAAQAGNEADPQHRDGLQGAAGLKPAGQVSLPFLAPTARH